MLGGSGFKPRKATFGTVQRARFQARELSGVPVKKESYEKEHRLDTYRCYCGSNLRRRLGLVVFG
jgi:hypothetical protein